MHMQRFASATPYNDAHLTESAQSRSIPSQQYERCMLHTPGLLRSSASEEQPADPIVWQSKFNQNVLTSLGLQRTRPKSIDQGLTMATLSRYVCTSTSKFFPRRKSATTEHSIQDTNLSQGIEMQKAPSCITCNLLCSSHENDASKRPRGQRGARVNQLMHTEQTLLVLTMTRQLKASLRD